MLKQNLEQREKPELIAIIQFGNTSPEERQVIASWIRDALTHKAAWSSNEQYKTLLANLEQAN